MSRARENARPTKQGGRGGGRESRSVRYLPVGPQPRQQPPPPALGPKAQRRAAVGAHTNGVCVCVCVCVCVNVTVNVNASLKKEH